MPGPKRKPDAEVSRRTLRRRAVERQRAAGELPPAPTPPPRIEPPLDDLDHGGAGRVEIRREVARLMVSGYSSACAVEEVCELFGIDERQGWRYVKAVREAWAKVEIEERPSHRAWLMLVQTDVLKDARKDGDHKAANGAIRNLIDLLGLKVSKVELQEGGLDALVAALKATPAQRDDRLAELEAKAAAEGVDLQGLGDGAHPG